MTKPQLLSWSQRRELSVKLAQLLAKIHHWDFCHRDCKPSNIMVQVPMRSCDGGDKSGLRLFLVDLDGLRLCFRHYFFLLFPRMRYANTDGWFFRFCHYADSHVAISRLARAVRDIKGVSNAEKMRVFCLYLDLIGYTGGQRGRLSCNRRLRHELWRKIERKVIRETERKTGEKTRKKAKKTCRKLTKTAENVEKGPEKNGNIGNMSKVDKKNLSQYDFKNILIVKPSSLGDIVRTLPFLPVLRERYPEARISWLVRPVFADLLRDNPYIDEIIEFDRKYFGKIFRNYGVTCDFFKFLGELRRRRFDLVIDAQGLFRSGFISVSTGAPVRLGFARAREMASIFYNCRVSLPDEQEHIVDSCWRLLKPLGLYELPKKFILPVASDQQYECAQLLNQQGVISSKPYFVILAGGTVAAKRWSSQKFAQLVVKLYEKYHYPVVLLGNGEVEREIALEIIRLASNMVIGSGVDAGKAADSGANSVISGIKVSDRDADIAADITLVNLVGKTSLQQMIAILGDAKMVIGNDSGPLHVAAALGVDLVALYGPTDPRVVGPYGQLDNVIQAGGDIERTQRYSGKSQHNINNITVGQVFEKIETILKS